MRGRTKVVLAGGLAILILGGAGLASLAGKNRGGVAVRIEPVTERDLVATVRASGWLRPGRSVDVQSDLMGRVVEIYVEEGDSVASGHLLLRIDATQYEAAVARARAGLSEARAREAQARAALIQAHQAERRARELQARDSTLVSAQAMEEAETNARVQEALLQAAEHGVAQAAAVLAEAQDRLSKTVIRAPMSGIVTRLNVEAGEMAIVPAGASAAMNPLAGLLLTISDLSVMEAVLRIHETDVTRIHIGDSAGVTLDAFPRQSFTGRVTRIGHSALRPPSQAATSGAGGQTQAIDFEVLVRLDEPPPMLRPDLSATGEVVTGRRSRVLAVPIIALTMREWDGLEPVADEGPAGDAARELAADGARDREGVFVVREGRAHFVPVEVGITGERYFEILGGLVAGDSVVAGPYDAIRRLEEGTPVRPLGANGAR